MKYALVVLALFYSVCLSYPSVPATHAQSAVCRSEPPIQLEAGKVLGAVLSANGGERLAVAHEGGVAVYDVLQTSSGQTTLKPIFTKDYAFPFEYTLPWHPIALSPDGTRLGVGQTGSITLITLATEADDYTGTPDFHPTLTFSRDGRWLASHAYYGSGSKRTVTSWVSIRKLDKTSPVHGEGFLPGIWMGALAFSPDSRWLAGTTDTGLWLWDMQADKRLALPDLAVKSQAPDWSPDNRHIVVGSDDGRVRIWDMASA